MNPATQRAKILAYCAEHGSITNREATVLLNINSASKRISELRNSADYVVDDITIYKRNDEGKVETKFKRYFITALEGGAS
jgi:uncharacterized protein YmfQ (DUF2313 family)